jgi:hypothetical protein
MIDLTDSEVDTIYNVVDAVRVKMMDGSDVNGDKLARLHNELEGRLNDAGFKVTVDVTPLLEGDAPTVRIDDRIDPMAFDAERKAWDIAHRDDDDDPGKKIEGVV